jgi:hypothetical protein
MPSLRGEWELSSRSDRGRALGCQSLRTVLGKANMSAPRPFGAALLFRHGANRPVRGNPFPRGMRQHGRTIDLPAAWSTAVVWTVAISCWLKVLRTMSSPLESGASRVRQIIQ